MRMVNKQFTGTQFSILVAFSTIPRIFSGPIAASIQMSMGWMGLYELSVVLALAYIPFLIGIKNQIKEITQENILAEKGGLSSIA
jgi:PAT family beta-lactamase induction signal transducer AmpG